MTLHGNECAIWMGNPPRDFRKVGGQFRKLSISGRIERDPRKSRARGLQDQI